MKKLNVNDRLLSKFEKICKKIDDNKIKIYLDDIDNYSVQEKYGKQIKRKIMDPYIDYDYAIVFYTPNSGYGNKYACVLSMLEFTGYGAELYPIMEISFDDFNTFLNNYEYIDGEWQRKESSNVIIEKNIVKSNDKKILKSLVEKYGKEHIVSKLNESKIDKLSFNEFMNKMQDARDENEMMVGIIVFSKDNWKTEYSLESRSYKINNMDNYFDNDKISQALWSSNLDGTDKNIRLDYYLPEWKKVDYCYFILPQEK